MEQPESAPREGCRETRESVHKVGCLQDMVSEPTVIPEDAAIKKRGHTVIVTGDETEVKIPQIPSIPKRAKASHIAERKEVENKPVEIAPEFVELSDKKTAVSNLPETVMPQRTSFSKDAIFSEKSLNAEKGPDEISESLEITLRSAEKDIEMTNVQNTARQSDDSVTAIGDMKNSTKANDLVDAQNVYGENVVTKDRVEDIAAPTEPASAGDENLTRINSNINQISQNVREKTYNKVQDASHNQELQEQYKEQRLFERDDKEEISADVQEAEGIKCIVNVEEQYAFETTDGENRISHSQETRVERGQETTSTAEKTVFLEKICEPIIESEVKVSAPDRVTENMLVGEVLQDSICIKDTVPEDTSCTIDARLKDTRVCDIEEQTDSDLKDTILEKIQEDIYKQENTDNTEFQKEVISADSVSETEPTQDTSAEQLSTQQPVTLAENTVQDVPVHKYNNDEVQESNEKRQDGAEKTIDIEKETWIKEPTERSENRVSDPEMVEGNTDQLVERLYQMTDKDKSLHDMTGTRGDEEKKADRFITHCLIQCTQREISRDNQDGEDKIKNKIHIGECQTVGKTEDIQTFAEQASEKFTYGGVEGGVQETQKEKDFINKTQYVIVLEQHDAAIKAKELEQEELDIQFIPEENKISETEKSQENYIDRVTHKQVQDTLEENVIEKYQYPDDTLEVGLANVNHNKVRETHMLPNERLEKEANGAEKENEQQLENSSRCSTNQEDSLKAEIINIPTEPDRPNKTGGQESLLEKCLLTNSSVLTDRIGKGTTEEVYPGTTDFEKTDTVGEVLDQEKEKDFLFWTNSGMNVDVATNEQHINKKGEVYSTGIWTIERLEEEADGSKDAADQEDLNTYLLIDGSLNVEEVYLGTTEVEQTDTLKQVFDQEKEKDSFFWTNNRLDVEAATTETIDQKDEVHDTSIWAIETLEEEADSPKEVPGQEDLNDCLFIDLNLNIEEVYVETTMIGKTEVSKQVLDQEKGQDSYLWTNNRLAVGAATNEETIDQKGEVHNQSSRTIERLEEEAERSKEVLDQEGLNTCHLIDGSLSMEEVYLGTTKIENTDINKQLCDQEKDSCPWRNDRLDVEEATNKEPMNQKDEVQSASIWAIERLEEEADSSKEVLDQDDLNTCLLVDRSLNMEEVYLGTTKIEKTGIAEQVLDQEKEKHSQILTNISLIVEPATNEETTDHKYEVYNTGIQKIQRLEEEEKDVVGQVDLKTCILIDGSVNMGQARIENPESRDHEAEEKWFWANEELPKEMASSEVAMDETYKVEKEPQECLLAKNSLYEALTLSGENDRVIDKIRDGQKYEQQERKEGNVEVRKEDSASLVEQVRNLQDAENRKEQQTQMEDTKLTIEIGINNTKTLEDVKYSLQGSSSQELEKVEEKIKTNANISKTADLLLGMKGEGIVLEAVSGEGKREGITMCFQDTFSPSTSTVMQHKVQAITEAKSIIPGEKISNWDNEQTLLLRSGQIESDIKCSEIIEESTAVSEERMFKETVPQETLKEPELQGIQHVRTEKVIEISADSDIILLDKPHSTTTIQENDFPQEIEVKVHKQSDAGNQGIKNVVETLVEQNNNLSSKDIEPSIQEFHSPSTYSETCKTYSLADSSSGADKNKAQLLSVSIPPPQNLGQQRSKEKKILSERAGQVGEVCDSL